MNARACTHIDQIQKVVPASLACADCARAGESWRRLRLCLTCGYVGCSDDSPNQHALRHYQDSHHPIIQSFEPGEDWRWCYVDQRYV